MRVFDTERQDWAGSRRERLFHPDQYLDVARQKAVRQNAAIVLAVAGLTFGVWALAWKDEPEPYREPAVTQQDTVEGATGGTGDGVPRAPSSPSGGISPGTSPRPLPGGYVSQQDPEGYRVALPRGWKRDSRSSQYGIDVVDYRSTDGSRRLQVFQVMETSPYESLKAAQAEARKLEGYETVSLAQVTGRTGAAAEHEYRADEISGERGGGPRHVIDRRFEAADGRRYALVAYGSDGDGPDDERELLDTALLWFCPPGMECAPPTG
ncbi:hypothetical protein [Streptomyces beigongshangae]|uniref:hypothetical protein n=1 Tax=Streptomyces beigongshangae TaxID=2841597 RepID=UPI001C861E62|nr:hypothetical protein [Streptomyces sp. REN17]